MARVGYIEARDRYERAKASLDESNDKLSKIGQPDKYGYIPSAESQEFIRKDALEWNVKHQKEYDEARRAYAAFNPPELRRKRVKASTYTEDFKVFCAIWPSLGDAIRKRLRNGERKPDLVRDALAAYLGVEKPTNFESDEDEGADADPTLLN